MNQESNQTDDQVWDLLKEARPAKASPSFSKNVLREVRLQQSEKKSGFWSQWLKPKYALAGLAVACAVVILPLAFDTSSPSSAASEGNTAHTSPQQNPSKEAYFDSIQEKSTVINDFTSVIDDDDLVGEFLVTFSENPDLLSENDLDLFFEF